MTAPHIGIYCCSCQINTVKLSGKLFDITHFWIVSFPLFFVFQGVNSFMLSAYLSVEWLASHLETALVIYSLTLSAAVSGCRVPRYTRSSWQPSLRAFHNAVHALARSWSCWTTFRLGHCPSGFVLLSNLDLFQFEMSVVIDLRSQCVWKKQDISRYRSKDNSLNKSCGWAVFLESLKGRSISNENRFWCRSSIIFA